MVDPIIRAIYYVEMLEGLPANDIEAMVELISANLAISSKYNIGLFYKSSSAMPQKEAMFEQLFTKVMGKIS